MNERIYNLLTMDFSSVIEMSVKSFHKAWQKTSLTLANVILDQLNIIFFRMKPYVT